MGEERGSLNRSPERVELEENTLFPFLKKILLSSIGESSTSSKHFLLSTISESSLCKSFDKSLRWVLLSVPVPFWMVDSSGGSLHLSPFIIISGAPQRGARSSRALSSRPATSTSWLRSRSVGVPTIGIRHDYYQRLSTANAVYDNIKCKVVER